MFPDKKSEWVAHPSILDGISWATVDIIGLSSGELNILVRGRNTKELGFGLSIVAMLYWVVDEFDYSVMEHGLPIYDGITYLRRAKKSKLLDTYRSESLKDTYPNCEHFALVGLDDCVEFITNRELHIAPLRSARELEEWVAQKGGNFSSLTKIQ